jgi:hypothetical protein
LALVLENARHADDEPRKGGQAVLGEHLLGRGPVGRGEGGGVGPALRTPDQRAQVERVDDDIPTRPDSSAPDDRLSRCGRGGTGRVTCWQAL